jgi:primosomal protein N' (replication factor Y)
VLAEFISDYYFSPLGVVLKGFIPKQTKEQKKKDGICGEIKKKNITLTKSQKEAVLKISKNNIQKILLYGSSGSGKTEVYIHSILELQKKNKDSQFLILLPEKTLTPQAIERYGVYFKKEEIGIISSNISKGQFYSTWQKIKSGEIKIIIGTRMAVFAPFKNLGLIVVDEEQDISYKQWDMNPRYDARIVAEKLAEINRCTIVRGTATPLIESFYRSKNKELELLILPILNLKSENKNYELNVKEKNLRNNYIVDMKKERWAKNYSCISKKLKSGIAYALKYKQQIVLFVNRQGMSIFSICESCKTVLKCPTCERSLVYINKGIYKCLHCEYKTGIIPKCEKCGGIAFKNIGLGTQKVAKEVSSFFPSAKIVVADSAVSRKHDFHDKIYKTFSRGEADILIGTHMISKGWDLPRVTLVGIIDTDNMLTFPDYSTEEKVFQNLIQVSGRVNRPGTHFPGVVIIQTFQPENKTIKLASEKNYEIFFENEIKEREALNLPPFGKLIKLIFQDYDFKKVEEKNIATYEVLNKITDIRISEPHIPLLSKIRGRWRKQIIIKIKNKIPTKLKIELRKIGSGWNIDVDPISLI